METLTNLLFELSNDDRLKILLELEEAPKNLTRIAKSLGFTAQETSRNVARLLQASLITRNSDGNYTLTQYGSISLKLLSSYRFLSENREYFLTHDPSDLPYHFLDRLGELRESSFQGDFVTNYVIEGEMAKQAEEYAYSMLQQFNVNALPTVARALPSNATYRETKQPIHISKIIWKGKP